MSADPVRADAAGGRGTGPFPWSPPVAQPVSWGNPFYSIPVSFVPIRVEHGRG